jgi:SAM-dependent methyltransferase
VNDGAGTTDWYDANAQTFFERTFAHGMEEDRARFQSHLPAGAAVLDAGCGAGRDAKAFADAGYAVTAFDGSAELARLARANTGLPVEHMRFEDMAWRAAFDGVWACGSLLHVPVHDLAGTFAGIAAALKPGGVLYASFKRGDGERWRDGRRFTDMSEAALRPRLAEAGLAPFRFWINDDLRPDAYPKEWVCLLARR